MSALADVRRTLKNPWVNNGLKLAITVGGFYLLLTHEVGTWVRGDDAEWSVPVEGEVTEVVVGGQVLPELADGGLDDPEAIGWEREGDLLHLRLPDGARPGGDVRVDGEEVGSLPIAKAISDYVQKVDGRTFVLWSLVAMAIKFVGVIASAGAWNLLLRGQGLRFPFFQQILTAFLIGRFIGTFLPSTIGLDSYTLYEAGRYSNQWHRAITAKALEKFIGIAGLFTGLFLTLPAGYVVLSSVIGERAPLVTGLIAVVSGGVTLAVVIGLAFPQLYRWLLKALLPLLPAMVRRHGERFVDAASAYQGKLGIVFGALVLKFVTHFTTAIVYFFTALAIGVVGVSFLPIVFGSLIQILGTLFSPTIAGEGAREAIQALLLSNYLGGAAQAVLSAALGFIAAEAATLWGGAFLWTRTARWRPRFMLVDGEQVDYAWLVDDEDVDGSVMDRVRASTPNG